MALAVMEQHEQHLGAVKSPFWNKRDILEQENRYYRAKKKLRKKKIKQAC